MSNGTDPIVVPSEIRNFEIRNLLARIKQAIEQIVGSQSRAVQMETEDDVRRVEALVKRLRDIWTLVTDKELDCPNLQPQDFPVLTIDQLQHIKNIDKFDIASTLAAWYQEIGRADSAQTGAAISAHDRRRGFDFLVRIEAKLAMLRDNLATDDAEAPDAASAASVSS